MQALPRYKSSKIKLPSYSLFFDLEPKVQMIYRIQVKLPSGYCYPAYKKNTKAEAIQSATRSFQDGIEFKVVAELLNLTEDWGYNYSGEQE